MLLPILMLGWMTRALVVLNALSAAELGATVLYHTLSRSAAAGATLDRDFANDAIGGGNTMEVKARAVVNASALWAAELSIASRLILPPNQLRLVQGVGHIAVKRLF